MSGSGTAAAWVDHLRAGGTTPWRRWRADVAEAGPPARDRPTAAPLPGAQQLELLRRLNEAGAPGPALAERVLRASAFGRGRPDLPLLGVERSRFGPPPVDPGTLPVGELLRVATLMVADALADLSADLPAGQGPAPHPARPPSRRRLLRRGYRLVGDPWQADRMREGLQRHGRTPGGLRPRVLVLSGPVDLLLADAWTRRCFTDGAPPWAEWLARHSGRALPAGADTARAADAWCARVGRARVTVVTEPSAVPRLVGARSRGTDLLPTPRPGPDAVELARQVAAALEVAVVPERRPGLLVDVLRPAMDRHCPPGRLAVPEEHQAWVRRRAERQRRRVLAAGYAVVGDLADLLPAPGRDEPTLPQGDGVLRLAGLLLAGGLVAPVGAGQATSTGGRRS